MSLRQFTYAVELAEAGSIRRAAERLNITHAALVHSIRSLEEQYGVRLFDRGRGVKAIPTEFGEIFIRHAREILLRHDDLNYEIQLTNDSGTGVLNITFGPYPHQLYGQRVIGMMISRYPNLHTNVSIRQFQQANRMLADHQTDIVIAELDLLSQYPDLEMVPIGQHIAAFICRPGHPLIEKKQLTIEDIVKYPWSCTRLPKRFMDFMPTNLGRAGIFDPKTMGFIPAIEIETVSGISSLLATNNALSPVPLVMLGSEIRKGELCVLPFYKPWLVTNYGFITLKQRNKPAALKKLMDEVLKIEEELFIDEQELAATFLKCEIAKKT